MANRVWAITESSGTLEVHQEGTRYTTNGSLAIIHDEVEKLETVRVEKEEAHAEFVSRKKEIPTVFESIWSQGVPHEGLRLYLPPATRVRFYLDIYTERVDPCIKVLHLPTDSVSFLAYEDVSTRTSKAPSSLIFAVCYSVAASLSAEECELRIAQQMGLHRDGSHFALSPFAIEMRRRLWWQICYFDLIISERCGMECTTLDMKSDTNFPLNARDSDLSPTMQHPPEPCSEYTELCEGRNDDLAKRAWETVADNMDITPDFNFGDITTPWLEWQAIWDELDREPMWGGGVTFSQ
ncbi:C6 transcription protein [Lasiodiplodia theobromae]|uniref:C6 transcription protein n=1 Tax=Lasiodiplodia theobromae TaxID=45133 RepID=UPI0015C3AC08|nr:C6 transcription protein [Lasiodiplodia theobromae]KAF4540654.1 C6 transcription protein [Lasiodiplodia theobromae]